jgi:hypothetical protein
MARRCDSEATDQRENVRGSFATRKIVRNIAPRWAQPPAHPHSPRRNVAQQPGHQTAGWPEPENLDAAVASNSVLVHDVTGDIVVKRVGMVW